MTLEHASKISPGANANVFRMRTDPAARMHLLCATDLTPRSQRAVARATLLANQLNAKLTLLHVIERDQGVLSCEALRDEVVREIASTGVPVRHHPQIEVREGGHVETIAALADEIDADLVILGAQDRKPLAPMIGVTAERIIAWAGRPALIVNLDPGVRYGAVVIAAELSDAFTRVVRIASSLKFLEAKSISVVHGVQSPHRGSLYAKGFDVHAAQRNLEAWERAARARLLLNLDAAGVDRSRFRIVFQQVRPIRAIQRVVRSVQPDLLIVGTKDRSMFNRVARGSVASDALRSIECDVLVASRETEAAAVLH
jgi:nucleotide-binding universal stress UspA family protein